MFGCLGVEVLTKNRCSGAQVFRCSGVQGVQGVQGVLVCFGVFCGVLELF